MYGEGFDFGILVTQVDRKSYLMTDEAGAYVKVGREYAGHGTVNRALEPLLCAEVGFYFFRFRLLRRLCHV